MNLSLGSGWRRPVQGCNWSSFRSSPTRPSPQQVSFLQLTSFRNREEAYDWSPSADDDPWYSALTRAFNKHQLKVMLRDAFIRKSQGRLWCLHSSCENMRSGQSSSVPWRYGYAPSAPGINGSLPCKPLATFLGWHPCCWVFSNEPYASPAPRPWRVPQWEDLSQGHWHLRGHCVQPCRCLVMYYIV